MAIAEGAIRVGAKATPKLAIVVLGATQQGTYLLPAHGRILLGSAAECDVQVPGDGVAPRHAIVHLEPELGLEALAPCRRGEDGTAHLLPGTVAPLKRGVPFYLGETLLVVHAMQTESLRVISTHGYFEARVAEECLRAARQDQRFVVARVRTGATLERTFVEQVLSNSTRQLDLVGDYGHSEFELLLLNTPSAGADVVIERIAQGLGAGAAVLFGKAEFPTDGRTADELLSGAEPGGLGRPRAAPSAPSVLPTAAMRALRELSERVAATNMSVLILGETGTGKERLAEEIHRLSPRNGHPFLRINCATLSETLLESELFGHERGAFTSADKTKPGLLETAHRGTIFLDEVGELPLSIQAKLLRVLEEKKFFRVGGLQPLEVDVRFVAATNRDLEQEVARERFRSDLYYRLAGLTLCIPPLRERLHEFEALARHFVEQATQKLGYKRPPAITDSALGLLKSYPWPGNIRELRNVMDRAVLLCGDGERVLVDHLPADRLQSRMIASSVVPLTPPAPPVATATANGDPAVHSTPSPDDLSLRPLRDQLFESERRRILQALERSAGNQTRAAELLGVSRRTLIKRLDVLGVPRPRKARGPAAS